MKIAFVCQPWDRMAPPVETGSVTLWTYEGARRMAAQADVIVYARRFPDQPSIQWHEGVQYRRISVARDLVKGLTKFVRPYKRQLIAMRAAAFPHDRPLFASYLYYWTYFIQIAHDLRAQRCDVVHIMNFSQCPAICKLLNSRTRTVLHMHCEWLTQLSPRVAEQRVRKTDVIIGCSEHIAEECRRSFPTFAGKCKSVWNGVDITQFSPPSGQGVRPNAKRILFAGRISPEKGIHVLLEAFKKIATTCPTASLELVGADSVPPKDYLVALSDDSIVRQLASFYCEKSYRSQLLEMIPASIADRVLFRAWVPHSQLVEHYRSADVFVFPSVCHEAFGMPVIEAMAVGVPVVATRSGGVPEIVDHGKTGLLVERGDASSLAEALLVLLQNEELRKAMGMAAREKAIRFFSWERIVGQLVRLYTDEFGVPMALAAVETTL